MGCSAAVSHQRQLDKQRGLLFKQGSADPLPTSASDFCVTPTASCSESLRWWLSVLKGHSIALLPLVWLSFRGQSCVSATQICLSVKFVLSIDFFLVYFFLLDKCRLFIETTQVRAVQKPLSWNILICIFTSLYLSLALLFPWLHFLLQNCFHIFTLESTSLTTVLSSHRDVFPLVQAQVCPEASAWISPVCE